MSNLAIRPTHRMLTCLVACAAALGLSCGQGADGPSKGSGIDGLDPTGQTVEFWYTHSGEREEALQDLIDLFNTTNPHGIQVRGEHVGRHSAIYKRMLLGIEGGPFPQLTEAYRNQAVAYYKAGVIVDLTRYMDSPKWGMSADEREDFIPGSLEQDNVNGVQTALLPNRSMEVLYYNEDWLDELGFDGPPADWEQFAAMCRAATERPFSRSRGKRSIGFAFDRDASRLAAMIFSRGGSLMNAAQTAYTFDTPETRASIELVRDLVAARAAVLSPRNQDRTAFAAGEALFAQRSSSGVPGFDAAVRAGAGFAWNVAGVPAGSDRQVHNVFGASLAVVKSDSPEQRLASWLFLKWFVEPVQQDRWASATGYFPVRQSIAHRLAPHFRVAYNLLEDGRPEPDVGGYEPVRALIIEALEQIVEQGGDPTEVLQRLEVEANETLVPYRK